MRNSVLMLSFLGFLSACGGGGTSTGDALYPTSPTVLKSYADGSGVVSVATDLGALGGLSNVVVISARLDDAVDALSGQIALVELPGGATDGQYYSGAAAGTTATGAPVVVMTTGEFLDPATGTFASVSLVDVDGVPGFASSGSAVGTLPSGVFTYTGTASVAAGAGTGDGTFAMTADFTQRTADISASVPANASGTPNPAYFFNAVGMTIDPTDGSFATGNALIGTSGVSSNAASINGFFAGANGEGVHGVVYENNPQESEHVGVFYGSR